MRAQAGIFSVCPCIIVQVYNRSMRIMPQSPIGKFAVAMMIMMSVLFELGGMMASMYDGVEAGATILDDIMARPGVAVLMILGFISGIGALVASIFAIARKKDYAFLAYVALVICLALASFLVGEFVT